MPLTGPGLKERHSLPGAIGRSGNPATRGSSPSTPASGGTDLDSRLLAPIMVFESRGPCPHRVQASRCAWSVGISRLRSRTASIRSTGGSMPNAMPRVGRSMGREISPTTDRYGRSLRERSDDRIVGRSALTHFLTSWQENHELGATFRSAQGVWSRMDERPDSVRDLFDAEYGAIVRLATLITGDLAAAEDIAQEVFARALSRWSRIASYDRPGAWLRRVAIRLAVREQGAATARVPRRRGCRGCECWTARSGSDRRAAGVDGQPTRRARALLLRRTVHRRGRGGARRAGEYCAFVLAARPCRPGRATGRY